MRLSDLTRQFLDDFRLPLRGHSIRSAEKYEEVLDQFHTFVIRSSGTNDVSELTPDRIESFIRACGANGNTGTTLNTKLAAISALGQFGVRWKDQRGQYVLAENPVLRVERPKREKPPERHLYRDEVLALLNVDARPYERLALAFLFYTRLRATAAAEAKVGDLAQDGACVRLSVREKGANHDTFVLAHEIAGPLMQALRERRAKPHEPLLLNTEGKAYTRQSLSEMVARLARRAGIRRVRVGAHLFARHTPASLAGQNGANEFQIAAMLRHRTLSTAKRYVHGVSAEAGAELVRAVLAGNPHASGS